MLNCPKESLSHSRFKLVTYYLITPIHMLCESRETKQCAAFMNTNRLYGYERCNLCAKVKVQILVQ